MTDSETPLSIMTRRGPTVLWNDSATRSELATSISWGAVGATCNPVIALSSIRSDLPRWTARLEELGAEMPEASESEIGWKVVEEVSLDAAALLLPAFHEHECRNGRLSMQTDPRLARNADALVAQAEYFSSLAPNIIVKVPATAVGMAAIEEATYRGVSINVTVCFTHAQVLATGEAIERGLMQISEFIGGDVVISPPFTWQQRYQRLGSSEPRMDVPVEPRILEALLTMPEFVKAYEPDGLTPDEFLAYGATARTLRQFLGADEEFDQIVRDIFIPAP